MPQLLFQDRRDIKRASVGLSIYYLVDFRRTSEAKTSLRLLTQKQISEVASTSKCRPLDLQRLEAQFLTGTVNTRLSAKISIAKSQIDNYVSPWHIHRRAVTQTR